MYTNTYGMDMQNTAFRKYVLRNQKTENKSRIMQNLIDICRESARLYSEYAKTRKWKQWK